MGYCETFKRIQPLYRSSRTRAGGASHCYKATHRRTPQTGRQESEQTRTKAEDQGFGFGPRFKVFPLIQPLFGYLAGDFGEGQTPSNNPRKRVHEIGHCHSYPSVIAKRLFVYVTKQVERLHADVGACKPRFKRLQKFSIVFVWTFPFTFSTA
jgi:hypothetical protein